MPVAIGKLAPARLRRARYRFRRLGVRSYVRYYRLERPERRKPRPRAGVPYELGNGASIELHENAALSLISHWVENGHAIQELGAFKRLAPQYRQFLDIGAADGIFAAAFAAMTGGTAWAFEPSPGMYDRLTGLCDVNPELAIHPQMVALGAHPGQRAVAVASDDQFRGAIASDEARAQMTVTTIDQFVAEHAIAPDFAKIDTEGMELEVLRGGQMAFGTSVQAILLEVHYDWLPKLGHSVKQVESLLTDYGFVIESLSGEPVRDLSTFARRHRELIPGYTTVVCRKRTHAGPRR